MKLLLMVMAILEAPAGLVLLIVPVIGVSKLLGTPLDTPGGLVMARVAGAALVSLAIACWQLRNGERGSASTSLIQAMLVYNIGAAAVLIYAGLRLKLQSDFLWPATLLHQGLALWCLITLWFTRRKAVLAATH
jgi:hypothetical protein